MATKKKASRKRAPVTPAPLGNPQQEETPPPMRVTIVERRAGWTERWAKAMEILIAAGRKKDPQ